jgi:FAD/FMN-containing dehydrogenase
MNSHPGATAVVLAPKMGLDIPTIMEMLPENLLLIVVNGFDAEEVTRKEEIVREIVERHGLFEIDPALFGEGFESLLSADPTKKPWGLENNLIGAHKGSFQFISVFVRLSDVPDLWKRFERLVAKYWKSSDPNISMKQAMTGILMAPHPYARCGPIEFDFWWDSGNPEHVKRGMQMLRKTTELVLEFGGFPFRNMFGFGEMVIPRLGVYTEILKEIRRTFDPQNLMHPDVLPVTEDYA